ncbi:MAG TPA: N-formylglutamate amidohydrolase [Hellea balneolensis]|uniref:N-formylglutamate amidohydrolase n=1 Tax=Hellea balneolensis TaxID=287478 RepID=A0A7C5LT78_9PROT|nr:N-formylglutamate amidohydrolase [Hellea balneolensis]
MFKDAPFIHLPATTPSAVFVFCDHATNHIPQSLKQLGLSDIDLNRHIAWDIGAETVTRMFCKTFGCSALLAGFSRLVIDPNRSLDSLDLIPETSDGTRIPGNQNLTPVEREFRINTFYKPYHLALETELDQVVAGAIDPLIISIHSFTREMASGLSRELDIGLLWKVDKSKAERVKAEIEAVHPYRIELNQPYSALKLNHTMDQHVIPRGLRHITLEICQDLIDTEQRAALMAQHLTQALRHFIYG